jgi:hypothetical protein
MSKTGGLFLKRSDRAVVSAIDKSRSTTELR